MLFQEKCARGFNSPTPHQSLDVETQHGESGSWGAYDVDGKLGEVS